MPPEAIVVANYERQDVADEPDLDRNIPWVPAELRVTVAKYEGIVHRPVGAIYTFVQVAQRLEAFDRYPIFPIFPGKEDERFGHRDSESR